MLTVSRLVPLHPEMQKEGEIHSLLWKLQHWVARILFRVPAANHVPAALLTSGQKCSKVRLQFYVHLTLFYCMLVLLLVSSSFVASRAFSCNSNNINIHLQYESVSVNKIVVLYFWATLYFFIYLSNEGCIIEREKSTPFSPD
jgi:hypothetical protein